MTETLSLPAHWKKMVGVKLHVPLSLANEVGKRAQPAALRFLFVLFFHSRNSGRTFSVCT